MPQVPTATAVIRAEPDGYDMAKVKLMGRQAAGHGFLRAAIQARGDHPIYGFTPRDHAAHGFKAIVEALDPAAPFVWIHAEHLQRVADVGVLYLADITVATHARLRLRAGLTSFSLCGVTHTTASAGAMDEIVGLLREPVTPWDALICTSSAVIETIRRVHDVEADYLRWRFGADVRLTPPQLPLIPLGVHCDDFAFVATERDGARRELGIEADDVVGLFVGRLVFHAKAHPFPMYRAMQQAAERTGRRMVLILSGWFPNPGIEEAFRTAAAQFAPDVRLIILEGRDPALRIRAWSAADIFLSLSDNIQETFGLTPIEAMAAGLPVVVSDWDGYRDTVRDQIDGFRIRTWAPAAGMGLTYARAMENGSFNYDHYCWAAAASTVVDIEGVTQAICALADNPDLRRRMGDAGQLRAREQFDWSVVYGQYQALFADLNARRLAARNDPALQALLAGAPAAASSRLDPYYAFGHYPTVAIDRNTRLSLAPGVTPADMRAALHHPVVNSVRMSLDIVERLFALASVGDLTVAEAAVKLGVNAPVASRSAGLLAKLGLIRLG